LQHRKRIIVAVYRSPKPYKILSDCFFNTRKIQNARLILKWTNQSIFCTSSAPMSVSSALFCTAAIPNVTDIAMHILCASRRTCSTTYSLVAGGFQWVELYIWKGEKEGKKLLLLLLEYIGIIIIRVLVPLLLLLQSVLHREIKSGGEKKFTVSKQKNNVLIGNLRLRFDWR